MTAEERLKAWQAAFASSDELTVLATAALLLALHAHANAALERAAAAVWTTPVLPPLEPLDDFHFVSKTIRLQLAAAIRALRGGGVDVVPSVS